MGKTNFTKVESSLEKGLEKMKVGKLVDQTASNKPATPKENSPKLYLVQSLRWELTRLPPELFHAIGVKRSAIAKLLKKPETLADKDWGLLAEIRAKIDAYKKENPDKAPPTPSNEELVEAERLRHINKRFNVSDRWLPLQ